MMKYEIRDVVSDYGIYENGELKLILNSRTNAEYIKAILEVDASRSNAATVYAPEVGGMSDEEILAVFHLCCADQNLCRSCPIYKKEGIEYCEQIEKRVMAIAKRALEKENDHENISD